ncbi:hypothetical protein LWI28_002632 [Acer negundo]|uniref:Uncharacterized protein n=1 Tax=Acer negundo TaxID=4023 RepID=A0AAD5INS4_ACENE|nr:hypothetical protein LWI28_002632 [Acer negundo]
MRGDIRILRSRVSKLRLPSYLLTRPTPRDELAKVSSLFASSLYNAESELPVSEWVDMACFSVRASSPNLAFPLFRCFLAAEASRPREIDQKKDLVQSFRDSKIDVLPNGN